MPNIKTSRPRPKTRTSQNARKHGLTARTTIVVDPADAAEYRRYHDAMFQTLKPQNIVQSTYADIIVQSAWRLRGLADIEADYMRRNLESHFGREARTHDAFMYLDAPKRFQVLGRYRAAIERTLHRTHKALRNLQQPQPLQN